MVPGLYLWCYEKDSKKTRDYKANVRAFLAQYVKGRPIDNWDYMKSWKSNVFEFRVQLQPPRENTRIFGAFIRADTFVAIHRKYRSDFGDKSDPKWDKAIDRVVDEIGGLFPGHLLVPCCPFSNCVTSNCSDINC